MSWPNFMDCPGCGGRALVNMVTSMPRESENDRFICACGVWLDGNGEPMIIHINTTVRVRSTTAAYLRDLLAEIIINPNKLPGYGQLIINELERRRQQYGELLT